LLDLWVSLLERFAVDSILPAAGLIAATAGILFAIYYWTRLGQDQLLAKCAIIAVLLHCVGFLSLFRLPASSIVHRDQEEVRVSIEWRSEDELRGEQALADLESSRADLPEDKLDPTPPEVVVDETTRPDRPEQESLATPSPSLDEPTPPEARPEPLMPTEDAIPVPEIASPTLVERPIQPAEPTLEKEGPSPSPSPIRNSPAPVPDPAIPEVADDVPVAMRLLEEKPSEPDLPAPAPSIDEARLARVDRPVIPESETVAPPETIEPPRRPMSESPTTPPAPREIDRQETSPVVLSKSSRPTEPAPMREETTLEVPSPSEVSVVVPKRFQTEPTIEIPDETAVIPAPTREVAPSETPRIDVAALAKRTEVAPAEMVGPRTFWENRIAPNRLEIVYRHGGSKETERAVADALEWLASHQSDDGRWDSDGFDLRCPASDKCAGHAVERQSDTGLTGLSLLAFLGAGHTHLSKSKYRETVRRGLSWLLRTQQADGDLQYGGRIYSHAMATISITEAFAMTKDERLKGPAQRAILWLASAQHPESGGWRYGPGQFGDTSVYGWAVLALRSARSAGLSVPDSTWIAARRWLPLVVSGRHQGLAAYRPGYPPSHAMTAEALFCRQVLEGRVDASLAAEAADHILTKLPDPSDYHLYYWYYGTLSLFHMGGPTWDRWNERLTATLLGSQRTSGHSKGSWDPGKPFGVDGGRIFSTACSCLCLEVYYRYLPLYQAGPGTSQ
jgi:hypothetical protein